ncbi:IrmA family protein [Pantoea sp. AS-PWVM4]|uniref:IrmA family protein n=1 Tax=Pantoea sp. AS-PWVM4 TaxID=1332069 RepID=UPI0026D85E14
MNMGRSSRLLLAAVLLGLGWQSTSLAETQRYISIRNTDNVWIQGVCSLVFRLDNGGAGEFNALALTIQLKDKTGHPLGEGTLNVPPFGDSDATRSVDTATEFDCEAVQNADSVSITQAEELLGNNTKKSLPLSTFDPQYYQPLKISIN